MSRVPKLIHCGSTTYRVLDSHIGLGVRDKTEIMYLKIEGPPIGKTHKRIVLFIYDEGMGGRPVPDFSWMDMDNRHISDESDVDERWEDIKDGFDDGIWGSIPVTSVEF